MENNLDDILIDPLPKQEETKGKSRRNILIAVAFVLLCAVVGLALYFVLGKEGADQGILAAHSELERIEGPVGGAQSQEDIELDKLIAQVRAETAVANETPQETPKQAEAKMGNEVMSGGEKAGAMASNAENKSLNPDPMQKEQKAEKKTEKSRVAPIPPKPAKDEATSIKAENPEVKSQAKPAVKSDEAKPSQKPKPASSAFSVLNPPKGFYFQVGVFSGKPNASFLSKIARFPHQIQKVERNGKLINRYLIGPFGSKDQAQSKFDAVQEGFGRPILIEIP